MRLSTGVPAHLALRKLENHVFLRGLEVPGAPIPRVLPWFLRSGSGRGRAGGGGPPGTVRRRLAGEFPEYTVKRGVPEASDLKSA